MTEAVVESRGRRAGVRLLLGMFLTLVGALLLAGNLGYHVPDRIWQMWPFLLLALGIAKLAWPARPEDARGGYWLIVVGLWGACNVFGWLGLDWDNSWPLFVLAIGLLLMLEGARGKRLGEGVGRVQ
jgi:hypothetical protein